MTGPHDDGVDEPLADALAAWAGLRLTGALVGGARTDARLGELDGRRVVVRRSTRDAAALAWQFDLQADLAAAGVGIPALVTADDGRRDVDGVWVEELATGHAPS